MSRASTTTFIRTDVGRKDWMDLVKGVAIIMVVIYHTMLFLRAIDYDAPGMGRAKIILETFPMPAFFVIAGMFQLRVPQWSFADTWKRRLSSYLYLYVLWSVLRFVFYLVVPNVRSADGAGATASDPLALAMILIWPSSSYWFIYALFVFTVLVWVMRRLPAWSQVAITGAVSVLFSSGILDVHNVGWNRMGEYLVFFTVGVLYSRRIGDAVHQAKGWQIVALLGVFAGVSVLLAFSSIAGAIPGVVLIAQVSSVAFAYTAAVHLTKLKPLSWLNYIGVRSLNVYLLHVFVIAGLAAVVLAIPALRIIPSRGWVLLAVITTLVIVFSLLLYRVLSRVTWLFVNPIRRRPGGSRGLRGKRGAKTAAEASATAAAAAPAAAAAASATAAAADHHQPPAVPAIETGAAVATEGSN